MVPEHGRAVAQAGVLVGHLVQELADEHAEQAVVALGDAHVGRRVALEPATPGGEPLGVVHVEQAAARPAEDGLVLAGGGGVEAGPVPEVGPGVVAGVDVVEVEAGGVEELLQGDVAPRGAASSASSAARSAMVRGSAFRMLDSTRSLATPVQLHVAAGGEEREALLDLPHDVGAGAAEERAEAAVVAELLAVVADEVEDGADGLALGLPEPAAELLEEEERALGGAEHEERVDGGDVHALVEEVHAEDDADVASLQLPERPLPLVVIRLTGDRHGRDAVLAEHAGHVARVGHAHAEAEGAELGRVAEVLGHLLEDALGPDVGAGDDVRERPLVVPPASPPRDLPEVEGVGDAVVGERREAVLVDGVPEPELGGDAVVEPVEHGQAVAPLGRGREPQQLRGRQPVQQPAVRRGRGVVELVHDDHVEVVGRDGVHAAGVERLDGREHVLELPRPPAPHPLLAEARVPEGVGERGAALRQDLLPVGDEEEARPGEPPSQPLVVQRGHDRLPRARGRHQQVPVPAALPRQLDLLQQPLLERVRPDLGGAQDHALGGRPVAVQGEGEAGGVVWLEVRFLPVAVEDRGHLLDDGAVARARDADVPLEARHLGRVREVGRAHVRGGEAGVAVEEPGLGVEARGGGVVGHAHVRPEVRSQSSATASVEPV